MEEQEVVYTERSPGTKEGHHPAFGVVSISKIQSTGSKLVNTPGEVRDLFSLRITQATQYTRDGQAHFYPGASLIEIQLSKSQFTEMITNLNTEGSPCTLKAHSGGRVPQLSSNYKEGFDLLVDDTLDELKNLKTEVNKDNERFEEILRKKSIGKDDRKELRNIYSYRYKTMKNNIKYYIKNMGEVSSKLVTKITVDVFESIKRKLQNSPDRLE